MAEKDSGRYRYEVYPALNKKQSNGTSAFKHSETSFKSLSSSLKGRQKCCTCFNPTTSPIWAGVLANIGICALLFAYSLLGSFMFLAIEGGASTIHQRTLASTNRQSPKPIQKLDNVTFSPAAIIDALEARQRTVENIWEITVSLNILYRENWTRLAAIEIARFQDQLIKRLAEDVSAQLDANLPSTGAVMLVAHSNNYPEYEWTFARAFLYSLTVLTTIGYVDNRARGLRYIIIQLLFTIKLMHYLRC